MDEKVKKGLKIVSAGAIAAGSIGFVLLGGTEAGAGAILSASVIALGAVTALIGLLKA